MIKIGIFIAIVLVVFILRRNIMDAILGSAFLFALIFGVIFLVDTYTFFPIRSIIGLEKYDDIKANPKENFIDFKDNVQEFGGNTYENLSELGEDLDTRYDTHFPNSEDEEENEDEDSSVNEDKLIEDKKEQNEEGKKEKEKVKVELNENEYLFKDIEKDLEGKLKNLPKREKEIIQGLTPMSTLEIKTDDFIFKTKRGKDYYIIEPTKKENK